MVLSSHYSIKSVVTEFTLGSIALTSCIVLDLYIVLDYSIRLLKLSTLVSQSLKCRQYLISTSLSLCLECH